ncbi:hypothetical protein PF003_g24008 [Phytophthora fragariae]|nr:hypothetical protein PF003_g24008 [Phytophthora fragariae]
MTKPTTRSAAPPTAEELRERLDDESKAVDDDTALRAQVELWTRIRAALAAHPLSSGIEAMDDLAMAAIAGDSATKRSLPGTAVLLPSTDLQTPQDPPVHALFAPTPARPKRPSPRGKGKARAPPAKKRRTLAKSRRSWFQLPSNAPKKIKEDLARLEDEADEHGTTPERLAYRWRDQRAWYDPKKHPDLYLEHWRFFMPHRPTFLILALYAPTDDAGARRKLKSVACQRRLLFISYNIEEFGYYGFLELFENAKLAKRLSKGKSVVTYDHKEFKASEQCEDDSDFEDDGEPVILPPTPPVTKPTRAVPKQQDHTGLTDSSDEEDEEFPPPGRPSGEEDAPSDGPGDDKPDENASDGSDDEPDPPKGSSDKKSDKKSGNKGDGNNSKSSSDKSDDAPSPDDKASKDAK